MLAPFGPLVHVLLIPKTFPKAAPVIVDQARTALLPWQQVKQALLLPMLDLCRYGDSEEDETSRKRKGPKIISEIVDGDCGVDGSLQRCGAQGSGHDVLHCGERLGLK